MNYFNICRCVLNTGFRSLNSNAYSHHVNRVRYFYHMNTKCLLYFPSFMRNLNESALSRTVLIKNVVKSIGISDKKSNEILEDNPNLIYSSPKRLQNIISTFLTWGFTQDNIKHLFEKSSYLMDINPADLAQTLKYLNEKVTVEKAITIVLITPELLLLKPDYFKTRIKELLSAFANIDLVELLTFTPLVFFEDWNDIMEKLRYIIHEMGLEQKEILSSRALGYTLEHIRARHKFLVRSGIYIMPKKRNIDSQCPSLVQIVSGKDIDFAKKCGLLFEEYKVHCKLLKVEYDNLNAKVDEEDIDDDDYN